MPTTDNKEGKLTKENDMSKQECRNGHDKSLSYIGYDGTMVCRKCRYNRVSRYRTNNLIKIRAAVNGGIL